MPIKKHPAKRRAGTRKPAGKLIPRKKLPLNPSILINLLRDMCYRYGLAMARFEFKGKIPKPPIDEFRERIVHHINLAESSLVKASSEKMNKSIEIVRKTLDERLRLEIQKIRNGINTEVERVYDALK